ncbi:MAG: tetratricopeptide repeat protein [Pseudobdellovibrio sp.]
MKQNKVFSLIAITALLFLSGCTKSAPSLNTLYKDYLATKDIKKEKYEDALSKYYNILEEDGDRAATHSNVGVLLNMVQKPEDALKSLQYALKLAEDKANAQEIFSVRYNLGVYFGALKKVPEALENYQAALDLVPTSKEVKTNIELLIQQQQQDQKKDGEQKKDGQGGGQGENQDKKDEGDKDQDKKDENKPNDQDGKDQKEKNPDKQGSPKYQPRPFKGDQLSEGDVKKILGELRNQEQKIRANFDKKEKGKTKNNEKDW